MDKDNVDTTKQTVDERFIRDQLGIRWSSELFTVIKNIVTEQYKDNRIKLLSELMTNYAQNPNCDTEYLGKLYKECVQELDDKLEFTSKGVFDELAKRIDVVETD